MAPHVGHTALSAVAGSVNVDWSDDALADLNRFAAFLEDHSPELASVVADAIIARIEPLSRHPKLGRPIAGHEEYRQLILQVLGSAYMFQYRYGGAYVLILQCSTRVSTSDTTDRECNSQYCRPHHG